jgi:hypothetical protein
MKSNHLGDSLIPVYSFEWENHENRTTEHIDFPDNIDAELVSEALAEFGREDTECEVTLSGYQT